MSLSTLAIRRHIGTLMVTLTVMVLGVLFLLRLPVDLLPGISYPRIGVRADAPGVSPEVAVDEVTRPLEQALAATEGVQQVVSQTREGRISLDLYFQPGGDIDQALNEANATLNRARNRLPDTISQPRLFKFDPSQLPVYELALTSAELPGVALRVFAEQELARELSTVAGVASVDVSGGVREEVQVNLDPARLQTVGVGLNQVLTALESRNQDTAGGRIQGPEAEPLTRVVGRFGSAEEIASLRFETGEPLRQVALREFAEVVDGTEDQRIFVQLNGQDAVKVSVQKQPDANTVAVVEGVQQRLEELRETGLFPADLLLNVTLDESVFIRNAIRNVAVAGLSGAGLAGLAVFLFLGSFRQTLIVVLAIPLATLVAVLLMGLFGLSLNVFSLGGLAMGVGIVVDNSIVMLENIARRVQSGPVLQQAAVGSRELESALVAATTTNLVVVLPFLLLGGFVSLLFNQLILTISFAVAASLAVALTVVPTLAARLLGGRASGVQQLGAMRWLDARLQGLTEGYGRLLARVLGRPLAVVAIATVLLGGSSIALARQLPQEILPAINTGQAGLFVSLPAGTTLEQNRAVMAAVDQLLLEQPETEYAFTVAGGFLFANITGENVLRGFSTVTLKPGTDVAAFCDRINGLLNQLNLVGTRMRISPDTVRGLILNNSPVRSDVDVILQGSNVDALQQAGAQVLTALEAATLASYLPDADPPQPEIQIRPDWQRAADVGLSAADIGATVQTVLNGSVPTQLQRGDRLIDVRVQTPNTLVRSPAQLRQLPVLSDARGPVRLGDVATIAQGQAPGEIQRINQRQVFIIEGRLTEGASLGDALAEVDDILADLTLPESISRLPSYAAQSNRQIQNAVVLLGGLAAFLVFAVMAVQYNSLLDPLVIMLTVPLALAGGIFGLFVTQTAIGATVVVGAVLLVGIVVNNAIIIVELANQIHGELGCSRTTAILKAAPQRLRPILMTTATTVLGLFPLALGIGEGSEFLQPMGIVVFSGLAVATGLTLFLVPCFYVVLHGKRLRAKR